MENKMYLDMEAWVAENWKSCHVFKCVYFISKVAYDLRFKHFYFRAKYIITNVQMPYTLNTSTMVLEIIASEWYKIR